MSIKTYTGRPGSGKSYNAVANVILPAIAQGRTVVTNVVLDKSAIYCDYPDANILTFPFGLTHTEIDQYCNLNRYPPGCVFVIDEGAKLFPTGWKVTAVPQTLLTFFTEHRHSVGQDGYASEIFILAQDNSQLAKFIRDLVDTTYHHVKLDKHGMASRFRVDIYDGSVSGASYRGDPVESKLGSYKDTITQYYKSHTQKSELADTALESSPDKRGSNVKFYLYALLSIPVTVVLVYFAVSTLGSLFSSQDQQTSYLDPAVVNPPKLNDRSSLTPSVSSSKGKNDPSNLSKDWRLTTVITGPRKVVAIIESEDRSRVLNAVSSCDYDKDIGEWYCLLNNQIVASYTGPAPDYSDEDSVFSFTD